MYLSALSTNVPIHSSFSIAAVKAALSESLPVWITLLLVLVTAILVGLNIHQRALTKQERNQKLDLSRRAEGYEKELEEARAAHEVDKQVFNKFMEAVPSDGTIRFLRTNNFAGFSFDWKELKDIDLFTNEHDGPEREFLDPALEAGRQLFRKNCEEFLHFLALNTFPLRNGRQSLPEEWEVENPKRFFESVKQIHDGSAAVCESYDGLVRNARKKLKV